MVQRKPKDLTYLTTVCQATNSYDEHGWHEYVERIFRRAIHAMCAVYTLPLIVLNFL